MNKAIHSRFQWNDPMLLDGQLTDDERQVADAARAYSQDRLAPRVLEAFRNEKTDAAIFREMGDLGLLGATIPESYGGAGLNYFCLCLVERGGDRIDWWWRSRLSVQSSKTIMVCNALVTP